MNAKSKILTDSWTPEEAFHVDWLVPTMKHGGGSVMVWGAISSHGLGLLIVLRGNIHRQPLSKHSHRSPSPMLQTLFPQEHHVFQDDNAPVHTSCCVQT